MVIQKDGGRIFYLGILFIRNILNSYLAGCIRVQRSGACLGPVAEGHRGPHGLVVLSCTLLMTVVVAVVLSSLELGSHD